MISLFGSSRQELYICSRCAFRASKVSSKTTKRWIGQKYLAKVALAEKQWQEWALEIKAQKKKSMLSILEERGLVHQVTGYTFSGIVIVLR
jgi:tyrosyl-tRNA synthetase